MHIIELNGTQNIFKFKSKQNENAHYTKHEPHQSASYENEK